MRNYFLLKPIYALFAFLSLSICSSLSLAKSIDLYDQPKEGKPIATLNSETGIITIFTPKNSDWLKVADPTNGNVGWVKSKDLDNTTIHMNMLQTTKNGQQYQVIQSNQPSQQLNRLMQQQAYEMQRIMQDFQESWMGGPRWFNEPRITPIFILPVKEITSNASPTNNQKPDNGPTTKK